MYKNFVSRQQSERLEYTVNAYQQKRFLIKMSLKKRPSNSLKNVQITSIII